MTILWYRGLAQGPEDELLPHVQQVLATHGVKLDPQPSPLEPLLEANGRLPLPARPAPNR